MAADAGADEEPIGTPRQSSERAETGLFVSSASSQAAEEGEALGGGGGFGEDRVKGPWSPEEDIVLGRLVGKFGARNWSLIARGIPGRTGKSCRLRWCNQLDPAVKRQPFSGMFCWKSFGAVTICFSPLIYAVLLFELGDEQVLTSFRMF